MKTTKGSPKPRATIEGSAKDVTPKSGKKIVEKSGQVRPVASKAPKSSARTKNPGPTAEKTTAKGTKSTPERPESGSIQASPTQAEPGSKAGRSSGLGAALVAGIAGGVISLGLLFLVAWFDGPVRELVAKLTGAEQAVQIAAAAKASADAATKLLAEEIGSREAALEPIRSGVAAFEVRRAQIDQNTSALTSTSGRLDRLADLPVQMTALNVRTAAAETRLDTLTSEAESRGQTVTSLASALNEAAKAGTSAAAVSAGLNRSISRLDNLESRLTLIESDIQRTSGTSAELETLRQGAKSQLASLKQELKAITARISGDRTRAETAKSNADLEALSAAFASGHPFLDELALFGDLTANADLARYAENGVPTTETLIAGLSDIPGENVLEAGDQGVFGRLVGLLGQAVSIRRTGGGSRNSGPLAEARQALESGNIQGAANIVSKANSGPEADDWVKLTQTRAEADKALSAFTSAIKAGARQSGD